MSPTSPHAFGTPAQVLPVRIYPSGKFRFSNVGGRWDLFAAVLPDAITRPGAGARSNAKRGGAFSEGKAHRHTVGSKVQMQENNYYKNLRPRHDQGGGGTDNKT